MSLNLSHHFLRETIGKCIAARKFREIDIVLQNVVTKLFWFFRCTSICHTGECSSSDTCKKRVKMYCKCKRRKQDVQCFRTKDQKVDCDDECLKIQEKVEIP